MIKQLDHGKEKRHVIIVLTSGAFSASISYIESKCVTWDVYAWSFRIYPIIAENITAENMIAENIITGKVIAEK